MRSHSRRAIEPDGLDGRSEILERIDAGFPVPTRITDEVVASALSANDHEMCRAARIPKSGDHRVACEEVRIQQEIRWLVFVVGQKAGGPTGGCLCGLFPVKPSFQSVAPRRDRQKFVQASRVGVDTVTGQHHRGGSDRATDLRKGLRRRSKRVGRPLGITLQILWTRNNKLAWKIHAARAGKRTFLHPCRQPETRRNAKRQREEKGYG